MSPRARYEEGCRRGVLLYQWDGERAVFPPRALPGLEWRESAGAGTVYATTTIRPSTPPCIGWPPCSAPASAGRRAPHRLPDRPGRGLPHDEPHGGADRRARARLLRGRGAAIPVIAGVGLADFRDVPPGTRPEDLMGQAAVRALDR